jgi:acyl-CoA synthetase (AMP-forming)/AMP-acid ligase II
VRENFATVLETVADVRADHTVVTHGDRSRTWRQLDERASRLAAFLAARGIGPEARVAIALYNGIEYLESVFAVLKLRAIPVNVNYRYQPEEMRHLFDDAQADLRWAQAVAEAAAASDPKATAPTELTSERPSEPKAAVPTGLRSEGACDRATREGGAQKRPEASEGE